MSLNKKNCTVIKAHHKLLVDNGRPLIEYNAYSKMNCIDSSRALLKFTLRYINMQTKKKLSIHTKIQQFRQKRMKASSHRRHAKFMKQILSQLSIITQNEEDSYEI